MKKSGWKVWHLPEAEIYHMTNKAYHAIEGPLDRLRALLKDDDNVLFAFLFGSHAEGTARKESDIDIAVYFRLLPHGAGKLAAIDALSETAGRDVHLAALNEASALLRHQVLKYGVPVIIKDREAYFHFREKTMANYDEYKFVSGMAVYDR